MKRIINRVLSVFLAVIMCSSIIPVTQIVQTADAATAHTQSEAVEWIKKLEGVKTDVDNYPAGEIYQCVDLVKAYYMYLGAPMPTGNANMYAENKLPEDWKRISYKDTPGFKAQPGDVAVFLGPYSSGHVALVISATATTMSVIEQNHDGSGNSPARKHDYSYNSASMKFFGVIRPDFCKHKYGSNYVCSACNAVNPDKIASMSPTTYIVVSDTAKSRVAPYQTYKEVNKYAKDTVVTVTGKMTNAEKNLWYRLSDGSWIYSEHIKQYSVTYTDIPDGIYRIKNVATGKYLIVDAGNGSNGYNVSVWPLVATATEQKWKLLEDSLGFKIHTELSSGRVLNSYGTTVKAGNNVNIWDFYGNDATQRWKFQKVSGGYVIRNVSVSSCVLSVGNGDDNVSVQTFASGDKKQIWTLESVTECSHSYNSGVVTTAPTCTKTGIKTFTCSLCNASYTETVPVTEHKFGSWKVTKNATCIATGTEQRNCSSCTKAETRSVSKTEHNYQSKTIAPTCTDYEKIQYTCKVCQHSYTEYIKDKFSAWSTSKPSGVADNLIESKTQYRYSDYEKITSYESSLSGYTKLGYIWESTNSGTVQYVKNWPSGFSTSHSLYSKYNKTPKTAYENSTYQITVKDATVSGYIYYHWCRGTYTKGPINRNTLNSYCSEYKSFHAFYSETAPSSLSSAGDGSYKYENGNCCKDSYWYFYVPVYSQSFYEYEKQYLYERWKDWSAWSDTVYSSNSTRKVETRTVYRYSTNQLGSHSYNNGVITKNATCTDAGIKTYTCTVCKHSYTESITKTAHSLATMTNSIDELCIKKMGNDVSCCSKCGYISKAENVDYSHYWEDKGIVTDAYGEKIKRYTCIDCGYNYDSALDDNGNPVRNRPDGSFYKAPNTDTVMLGDIDIDGKITATDARLALRSAVGLENFGDTKVVAADVNKDGSVTSSDARLILRAAVGLERL